jgi:hypothetical protein
LTPISLSSHLPAYNINPLAQPETSRAIPRVPTRNLSHE